MAKTKRTRYVNLLLNDHEKAKLENYSNKVELSLNEVLRNFINGLPE